MNKHLRWVIPATLSLVALAGLLFGFQSLARAGFLLPPQRVDVEPDPGGHTAPVDSSISITYDQDMDPATVNPQSFAVHARQTGWLIETLGVVSGTITLDPLSDLHAGELVQVSATTATLSLSGEAPVTPTVWQFTAAPWSGNAYFHPVQSWTNMYNRDAALGDLDGDGDLDAVTVQCEELVGVLHNDGSGAFTQVQQVTLPGADCIADVELGDLDGDGDLDAFLVDYTEISPDRILLNNGDGTFSLSAKSVPSILNIYGELGDLDGDGDLDIFVAAGGDHQGTIRIWMNDGAGGFTLGDDFDDSYQHTGVALGDLDGDGDLDAFSAGWYWTFNKVWLNDGTGAFSQHQSIPGANTYAPLLGDLDGDGDLDAYLSTIIRNVGNTPDQVWLNNGSGHFTNSGQALETAYGVLPALGDLDADGDLDVYVPGDVTEVAPDEVWLNDGLGNFSLGYRMDESFLGAFVTLGDLDGDGDLDALVSDLEANHYIFLNAGWLEAEPIPVAEGLATWSVQCPEQPDSFYLVGGIVTGGTIADVYRYDANTNSWTELAPMPALRRAAALACYQGKIYVAGGWDNDTVYASLYIYDIASDTWSQGENLPNVIWVAALGAWDGKLYLAGGTRINIPWTPVDQVDVYDIATNTWTAGGGTPMPLATSLPAWRQAGPYLYIAGGLVGDGIHVRDETQRYNMATNTWELGPNLTIPQWGGALAITGSRLYILGGSDSIITWNLLDKVDRLELADWPGGEWMSLGDPLPQANFLPATACTEAIAGGEIWATGGTDLDVVFYNDNLYRPAEPCIHYGLALTPESLSGEGEPGETIDYLLTLTNTGNTSDYFSLTASGLWAITLPETMGPLGAGESLVITASVTIPLDAQGGDADTASITAASISNPAQADSSILTTSANAIYGLQLEVDPTGLTGMPGEAVTFSVQISNQGNITDTYDLDCLGNEWPMDMPITQVTLAVGESADVDVIVHIPVQAMPGQQDAMTFTAVSQGDPDEAGEVELTTTVIGNLIYLPVIVR